MQLDDTGLVLGGLPLADARRLEAVYLEWQAMP